MLMAVKQEIDFHRVLPQHADIHRRLENWGRWCNGTGAASVSPMFRLYRTPARGRTEVASGPGVDSMDAKRLSRFMGVIPEKQRKALAWCYVKPVSPRKAAAELGVTMEHLDCLVHEGREHLRILGA